jgi:hypothetical protein
MLRKVVVGIPQGSDQIGPWQNHPYTRWWTKNRGSEKGNERLDLELREDPVRFQYNFVPVFSL